MTPTLKQIDISKIKDNKHPDMEVGKHYLFCRVWSSQPGQKFWYAGELEIQYNGMHLNYGGLGCTIEGSLIKEIYEIVEDTPKSTPVVDLSIGYPAMCSGKEDIFYIGDM